MKILRLVGSTAFVIGLFTLIFAGMPWYIYNYPVPLWFKIAFFGVLGGILLVILSVAIEQRQGKARGEELPTVSPGLR